MYPGTFLNSTLLKVGQCTLSLISLFRDVDEKEYEEGALSEMIQYGNLNVNRFLIILEIFFLFVS